MTDNDDDDNDDDDDDYDELFYGDANKRLHSLS